jgi:putative tryptophan/tyrosine transport system substrate-binding protein
MSHMRRREFITLIGGAAAAWSLTAGAQQADRVRRIGLLMSSVETDPIGQERVEAFRSGLRELGWVEGRNLEILLRWSGVDVARIQEYTAELVHLAPDLIVANATPGIAALKRATQSIPLVFVVVNDPLAQGIVSSVARPEGNITGFSFLDYSVVEKSLELLKEVAPGIARVAVMFNPETYAPRLRARVASSPRT